MSVHAAAARAPCAVVAERSRGAVGRPARDALRDATRSTHLRLHRLPVFVDLEAGRLSRDGYRALLQRLVAYHRPFERLLERHADVLADQGLALGAMRRADRLVDDLRALATADDDGATATAVHLDTRVAFPSPSNAAELFGMLYVREGSTRGGRVLARRLDALLGDGVAGRTFFAGSVDDEARWSCVCTALDRVAAASPDGPDDLIRGAHRAFDHFERLFAAPPA